LSGILLQPALIILQLLFVSGGDEALWPSAVGTSLTLCVFVHHAVLKDAALALSLLRLLLDGLDIARRPLVRV
jgi:hypothetical protein